MTSCSTPRVFSFQDINYYTSSSGQAQLGNLGLMSANDGFGFQRAAFLSDCQDQGLAASVDATIHGMLPLQNAFGPGTKAKALSALLGVPLETLNDFHVLLFSINPLDAQRAAPNWPEACKSLVARDSDRTRLIVSVAALIPHKKLASQGDLHKLTAQISARGHLIVNVHGKKMVQISVSPQSIFAWRSGHFCWAQDDSTKEPILRADDPAFDACPEGYEQTPLPGSTWSNIPEVPPEVAETEMSADAEVQPDAPAETAE
jgi:hypothetical protein